MRSGMNKRHIRLQAMMEAIIICALIAFILLLDNYLRCTYSIWADCQWVLDQTKVIIGLILGIIPAIIYYFVRIENA